MRLNQQDRETEPRFVGPPTRGDFGGGPRGGGYGGYAGGAGGGGGYGMGGGGGGGGAPRQLYISNVCVPCLSLCYSLVAQVINSLNSFPSMSVGKT